MSKLFSKIMEMVGYVPRGTCTASAPVNNVVEHVLRPLRREIKWTQADAHTWHKFRECETWKKLAAMSDDSMIQSMLPQSGPYREDPVRQQAFVLGRSVQLDYLAEFAVAPPVTEDPGPESEFAEEP